MLRYTQPAASARVPDMFHFLYVFIMAVINSLAIGKAVKSAGNLTYKTVRGRTIASQRITQNKSNTIAQSAQRSKFSMSSQAMSLISAYIDACYEKSKYGSSRNAFLKENKNFNLGGLLPEIKEGAVTLADGMLLSLERGSDNSQAIQLVSKGTLPAVLNLPTEVRASYSYGGQTYNNISAYSDNTNGYSVSLASPAKLENVKIAAFGFSAAGMVTAVGELVDTTVHLFTFEGDSDLSTAMASCYAYYDAAGMVTKIDVVGMCGTLPNPDFGLIIAVPIVNGKTITTRAVFLANPAA